MSTLCGICYCEIENEISLLKCGEHKFCKVCIDEYFSSMIAEQGKHHLLKCPQADCEARPEKDELKTLVSPEVYLKYLKFANNFRVLNDKTLMFCSNPDCCEVVKKKGKNVECKACLRKTCVKCGSQSHPGKKCDTDLVDNYLHQVKIHVCPNCKTKIEKDGGCPHMYCPQCLHKWCWTCGLNYERWYHKLLFGGILCELLNGVTFGFKDPFDKWHWIFRYLLTLLFWVLTPVIFISGCIFAYFYAHYKENKYPFE